MSKDFFYTTKTIQYFMTTFEVEGLLTIQVNFSIEAEDLAQAQELAKEELNTHYRLDYGDDCRDAEGVVIYDISVEPLEE